MRVRVRRDTLDGYRGQMGLGYFTCATGGLYGGVMMSGGGVIGVCFAFGFGIGFGIHIFPLTGFSFGSR